MFMETSALDSTNVEAAFIDVLTGCPAPPDFLFPFSSPLLILLLLPRPPPAIQKKVASREVTRGSISAVTLSNPITPTETEEKSRSCCKSS